MDKAAADGDNAGKADDDDDNDNDDAEVEDAAGTFAPPPFSLRCRICDAMRAVSTAVLGVRMGDTM